MGGVRPESLPTRSGGGMLRYEIGVVLLARLAVAHDRHGQGLGRDLLIEAIERAATAGQHVAARFIAIDPIDQNARSFYTAWPVMPGMPELPGAGLRSHRRTARS